MLTALDHVIVAVRDLPAASRRYAALLDLPPSWRGEHPGAATANTLFRLDNTYLELLAPHGEGPVGAQIAARLEARGEGVLGLAFATDDAEATRARFEDRGLEPAPVATGLGRDTDSGAFREWSNVMLPASRTRGVLLFAIEHRSPPETLPRVAPMGEPMAAVAALDHVVVRSQDAAATRDVYGDAGLGLRLALDKRFPEFGFHGLFFRVGGATIEVGAPLDPPADAAAEDTLWGLAWKVGDVEAARARLGAAGFDVSDSRRGRKPGTRVFTVRAETHGVATLVIGAG